MAARFLRSVIPPEISNSFPDELQARLDAGDDYDNTLDEEAALTRLHLHGVGRIVPGGCLLSVNSGTLRMSDGWFQAGPGVESTDPAYFIGVRLAEVDGVPGYIEITGDDAPPQLGRAHV